jgi:hypothetical protein
MVIIIAVAMTLYVVLQRRAARWLRLRARGGVR